MALSPRLVAVVAFVALLPIAVYTLESGELGGPTLVAGITNVVLIGGSLLLMFGPGANENRASTNGTHA